jgi:hypothetical protein
MDGDGGDGLGVEEEGAAVAVDIERWARGRAMIARRPATADRDTMRLRGNMLLFINKC